MLLFIKMYKAALILEPALHEIQKRGLSNEICSNGSVYYVVLVVLTSEFIDEILRWNYLNEGHEGRIMRSFFFRYLTLQGKR